MEDEQDRAEARSYAETLKGSSVASTRARAFIIPPFTSIADVASILAGTAVRVGAQNMHWADAGAWTGEISPVMIGDVGATLIEIGHSERRMHFAESDETVALKIKAVLAHGLPALVCVGDTRQEYEAGQTSAVLAKQVRSALSAAKAQDRDRIVSAYEPVWSIGEGGIPADPDFADRQHSFIKEESQASTLILLRYDYGRDVTNIPREVSICFSCQIALSSVAEVLAWSICRRRAFRAGSLSLIVHRHANTFAS